MKNAIKPYEEFAVGQVILVSTKSHTKEITVVSVMPPKNNRKGYLVYEEGGRSRTVTIGSDAIKLTGHEAKISKAS